MDDQRLLGVVEPREIHHRGIEAEEVAELQRRVVAVPLQRELAVQIGVVGIADRRDGGKAVERAAQHDDDEARIARARGARPARDRGGSEGGAGHAEQSAARRDGAKDSGMAYLLWNSGDRMSSA